MDARNDHHCRADNEKVELISVGPNIDTANFAMRRLSDDSIDRWIPLQVNFGTADGSQKIGGCRRRPRGKPGNARSMSSVASEL